ncbi:hypothetical protein ACFQ15_10230 [Sphingomonas hankookensis]|uniref:hypothetical protein n=1 Tax=Sphingomonas hankookensis TaxID=563996 RepID=UPI001F5A3AF7|nr:hypothetical protein [Sphingomonas hankookensis]
MAEKLVFRTGWPKRLLSWLLILGGSAALIALVDAMARHWSTLPATEIWSGVFIALFILCFVAGGFAIQDFRWSIDGDVIRIHRLYRTTTIDLTKVAGFGRTVFVIGVFPVAHIDLYDGRLQPIARIPIDFRDLPQAETWLSWRFRLVVDEGSAAFPKRRFVEED